MGETNQVFVTPCFDGYVFVLNYNQPLENKDLLQEIALQFEEVQYYASHRVVDLSCWIKYVNVKLIRRFFL